MAKPNYNYEKRQRELAKKKKKEEKLRKKQESKEQSSTDFEGNSGPGAEQPGAFDRPLGQ